jgi:hypothetical protein
MIAIDVTMVQANGDPFSFGTLTPIVDVHYVKLIEFFNSCVDDGLLLNTVKFDVATYQEGEPHITRYYAINTVKATEFQERFVSVTAPFSIKQFWTANGFEITTVTQTQIIFENEPTDDLYDLVNVNTNLLWGEIYPVNA